MSYDVLLEELTGAGADLRSMTSAIACYSLQLANVEPASIGHVELAAWLVAVGEQCDQAGRALHDGAVGLADSLDVTAAHYARADQGTATRFGGSPFGSPFGTPFPARPASPVFGPPAPPVSGDGQ